MFRAKKQVVKVGNKYAARYKKWWQIRWRYIGVHHCWIGSDVSFRETYIIVDSEEEAIEKLNAWFKLNVLVVKES